MSDEPRIFLGVDIGTGGVRMLAVSDAGEVVASAAVPFDQTVLAMHEDGHEQPAEAWWHALRQSAEKVMRQLREAGIAPSRLAAIAVDGTSGTVVPIDSAGTPLRPALMYNDCRAVLEAEQLNVVGAELCRKLGYQFNASFALAKIYWLKNHEPAVFRQASHFVHQADYVVGCLTGASAVSDYSNALKTGFDLVEEAWPSWIGQVLGSPHRLPRVVAPGTSIGTVSAVAAAATGLPQGLAVIAGATDGTTGCLASGARRPGDYNTTLGTTLVFKGISQRLCCHPQGIIYCHKLPGGHWLPGAASNTGAEWLAKRYPEGYPASIDAAVAEKLPSEILAYPLVRPGERFPFLSKKAAGFTIPDTSDPIESHAASLQGVALVERLGYEVLDGVAGTSGGEVFSTGGGSRNDLWMQCRADVTGRIFHRPACPESAFGSAILAASGTIHRGLDEAIEKMVRIEKTFWPNPERAAVYDRIYGRFLEVLKTRGYL